MNTILLHPTDVLFFKDGRPMSGSLSGCGAAWPLPTVINAALHAALHRAGISGVHPHDHQGGNGIGKDARKFGSLLTAGPFPVDSDQNWYFPRPLDANIKDSTAVSFRPIANTGPSSLPQCLRLKYPVANTEKNASKDVLAPWWSLDAWSAYWNGAEATGESHFLSDNAFSDHEHTYGIGIAPDTATQDGERFYSASYLRLKPGWRLGLLAEAHDKISGDPDNKRDLLHTLLPNSGTETPILVGGQQRVCTATRQHGQPLPLPLGASIAGTRVKWVLLTPAIFPEIGEHPGGWLPSWIRHTDGQVMLKAGDTARQEREGRETWRKRVAGLPEIPAHLAAALVGKPLPVTGWALPNGTDREQGGAKSTHLAVPAGSVYYFECASPEAAQALAAALNWHGSPQLPTPDSQLIKNRRSTLMGEKGFGLGVCGAWNFYPDSQKTEH